MSGIDKTKNNTFIITTNSTVWTNYKVDAWRILKKVKFLSSWTAIKLQIQYAKFIWHVMKKKGDFFKLIDESSKWVFDANEVGYINQLNWLQN